MRRHSKLDLAPLIALTFLLHGCAARPATEEEATTTAGTATETSDALSGAGSESTETGESSSTAQSPELLPHEQAAVLACEALDAVLPVAIPYGETPYREDGFRMGNDFPYAFKMDSTELNPWGSEHYCYSVGAPQDPPDDWWFLGGDWRDDDGEIHVYMATADVDSVVYTGSSEIYTDEWPGSPQTDAIEFDVSALCPQLPRVWIPDVNGHPENAGTVCMHHTEPIAEAVFVWVP